MILDANLPPILETAPWMLSDGGALDVDTCPDCWERRAHIERYVWAGKVCTGMRVLDFGCGVGYGSEMLMEAGAARVGMANAGSCGGSNASVTMSAPLSTRGSGKLRAPSAAPSKMCTRVA